MNYYAGMDVSLEQVSVCVIDASGKIVREGKVLSEPEALIAWFGALGIGVTRIGLEAAGGKRPRSERPYASITILGAGLPAPTAI